jgi:hypothetical protein
VGGSTATTPLPANWNSHVPSASLTSVSLLESTILKAPVTATLEFAVDTPTSIRLGVGYVSIETPV